MPLSETDMISAPIEVHSKEVEDGYINIGKEEDKFEEENMQKEQVQKSLEEKDAEYDPVDVADEVENVGNVNANIALINEISAPHEEVQSKEIEDGYVSIGKDEEKETDDLKNQPSAITAHIEMREAVEPNYDMDTPLVTLPSIEKQQNKENSTHMKKDYS